MPENPANQCTSCPLVTSINEKTCKRLPLIDVGNSFQATDTKGYRGFRGARSGPDAAPIPVDENSSIRGAEGSVLALA